MKLSCHFFLLFIFFCYAYSVDLPIKNYENMSSFSSSSQKIKVNNTILTTINGTSISVMDVMKKMDLAFHRSYPDLINSTQARYQFYSSSWKTILTEMINTELMLAEAETRDVKVSDGEVREEMEERFGPNIMLTLEEIGLSYDEALKMVKTEMLVNRMTWYFVQAKAIQSVTPQSIRQAYRFFLEENPPIEKWQYQVITIRSSEEKVSTETAKKLSFLLQKEQKEPSQLEKQLKELEKNFPSSSIQVSKNLSVTSKEIAQSHKKILQNLQKNSYSQPITQTSRLDQRVVLRFFYLKEYEKIKPPSFAKMSPKIKNTLLQEALVKFSDEYFQKLRHRYNYNEKEISDGFQPFSIQ